MNEPRIVYEHDMPKWREHPCSWDVFAYGTRKPMPNEIGCIVSHVEVHANWGSFSTRECADSVVVAHIMRNPE